MPRYLARFTDPLGEIVLELPQYMADQEEQVTLRTSIDSIPLGNYAADLLGGRMSLAGVVRVRHRATLVEPVDADLERIRSILRRVGRGKLWLVLEDGSMRWAWARAEEAGSFTISAGKPLTAGVSLTFLRLSDWYAPTAQEVARSGSGMLTCTVAGTVPTAELEILFVANSAGGYSNPSVQNQATGDQFTVNCTASTAGSRLRVIPARWQALESVDGGVTWTDVTAELSVPTIQATVLRLVPGANPLQVSGVAAGEVSVRWFDAYA
jgi:hypothetical protein